MMPVFRFALCQLNPIVGDIEENLRKILGFYKRAREYKSDIVVFPELALCGYPPEDLLFKNDFISANNKAIKSLVRIIDYPSAIIGFAHLQEKNLYNSAGIISKRKLLGIYHKMRLPNYGVFDEKRYFKEGNLPLILYANGVKIGVEICEDLWDPLGPSLLESKMGAEAIVTINASPYAIGKPLQRERLIRKTARECNCHLLYLNLTGGQDELVFDGQSMVSDPSGQIQVRGKAFEEDIILCDLNLKGKRKAKGKKMAQVIKIPDPKQKDSLPFNECGVKPLPFESEVYKALLLGTRDYIKKNLFKSVIIGISGGIDSALVAKIACDAIGRENVYGVFMPSKFTSIESRRCVYDLKIRLKIRLVEIPIDSIFRENLESLGEIFGDMPANETEENIQARIRGILLMALSNKFGHLVLTTGNKSEMSVGYATLYGDMAGGFAVIKDIPKTLVYKIARFCNKNGTIIPEEIIERAPTAELKENQRDLDSLPPYSILDKILKAYVEDDLPVKKIKKMFNPATVEMVIRWVDKSEYKRRQSPPGIKITARALGKDRRMPITQAFYRQNNIKKS